MQPVWFKRALVARFFWCLAALEKRQASLSDEAERVFQEQGLAAFQDHEERRALHPLPPGPFMPLLEALHRLTAPAEK